MHWTQQAVLQPVARSAAEVLKSGDAGFHVPVRQCHEGSAPGHFAMVCRAAASEMRCVSTSLRTRNRSRGRGDTLSSVQSPSYGPPHAGKRDVTVPWRNGSPAHKTATRRPPICKFLSAGQDHCHVRVVHGQHRDHRAGAAVERHPQSRRPCARAEPAKPSDYTWFVLCPKSLVDGEMVYGQSPNLGDASHRRRAVRRPANGVETGSPRTVRVRAAPPTVSVRRSPRPRRSRMKRGLRQGDRRSTRPRASTSRGTGRCGGASPG